jgi:hypothetical protein
MPAPSEAEPPLPKRRMYRTQLTSRSHFRRRSLRSSSTPAPCPQVWLCMQERDPDAHRLLLARAPHYFRVSSWFSTG